jgi:hypothetical protein
LIPLHDGSTCIFTFKIIKRYSSQVVLNIIAKIEGENTRAILKSSAEEVVPFLVENIRLMAINNPIVPFSPTL